MSAIINTGGGGSGSGTNLGWADVYSFATAIDQTSITGGTGNDVSYAVTAAIATLPATGGVLYFRPGRYVTVGGFTITAPCTILGTGNAVVESDTWTVGTSLCSVECTVNNNVLFDLEGHDSGVRDIALLNTAVATPVSGSTSISQMWVPAGNVKLVGS